MTAQRRRRWREEVNSGSLFLQIWQLREATLNQQLGSFPTESKAEIFPQCRQDWPLPPPINRGGVNGLREEKIELKVGRKPAFPAHFSCNRSFLCLLSPPWLSATTIFITRLLSIIPTSSSHQTISRGGCITSLSLSLLCKNILLCHCNQPQQQQQQKQRPTPCPEALFLPKDSQGSSSLSSHSDNSNHELPFSFAGLCFLPLPAVTRASHRPHHRSHTVHHRSGRQLPQRQVSLPPPFFFFLPSLLSLHVNSATWIIIHVALFRAT